MRHPRGKLLLPNELLLGSSAALLQAAHTIAFQLHHLQLHAAVSVTMIAAAHRALVGTNYSILAANTCRCTQDKKPKSKYLLLHSHCLIHCQFYSDPLSCLCLPSIRRLQTALDRLTIFPPGPPQLLSSSAAVTLATEQRRGCQLSLTLQAKTSWAR